MRIYLGILVVCLSGTGCKSAPRTPNLSQSGDVDGAIDDPNQPEDPSDPDSTGPGDTGDGIVPTKEALDLKILQSETALSLLSHSQLENALHVVFNISNDEKLIDTNLPTYPSGTLFDNDSAAMSLSYSFLLPYAEVSNNLIEKFVLKSERYLNWIPASAPKSQNLDRAKAIVSPLLKTAFRGQLNDQELTSIAQAFVAASETFPADGFDKAGMRALIPAIVLSPKFLYRAQFGGESSNETTALQTHEIAARLAASLWNSIPDSKLLAQAATLKPDQIEKLVESMAADSRFEEQITRFNMQALLANRIHQIQRSDMHWTPKNKDLIRQETVAFFQHITKAEKGLNEILNAPYAFVSDASAPFYGVNSPGATPVKMDLNPKRRRGFYSQVGFLAFNGDALGNLTIRRGSSVVKSLVCTNALSGERKDPAPIQPDLKMTTRQSVSRATDGCGGSCHKPLMNPIGFAFEVFNKDGKWQDTDNNQKIDASDVLYFSKERTIEFEGAAEFSTKLSTMLETHRCYASKVVQYVFGRKASLAERDLIDQLASASLNGASTKDLFIQTVKSPPFRLRNSK